MNYKAEIIKLNKRLLKVDLEYKQLKSFVENLQLDVAKEVELELILNSHTIPDLPMYKIAGYDHGNGYSVDVVSQAQATDRKEKKNYTKGYFIERHLNKFEPDEIKPGDVVEFIDRGKDKFFVHSIEKSEVDKAHQILSIQRIGNYMQLIGSVFFADIKDVKKYRGVR